MPRRHAMVKRPIYIDSNLGGQDQATPGQVRFRLPNPLKLVSRVRLRDAQIPRLDDITYIAIGLRCGRGSGAYIDNVQVPYSPSAVTTTGTFSVTGVTPGPPLFAILPIAQATSVSTIDYAANVPYVYLNQERYEFEFKPPINFMEELEVQLYRPPAPSSPNVFAPYDTTVFLVTLDAAPSQDLTGASVTNRPLTQNQSQPHFFTAVVVGGSGTRLLLGSVSSAAAVAAYQTFLGQAGLLASERTLFTTQGAAVSTVSAVQRLTTQTTLNLEFDCAA